MPEDPLVSFNWFVTVGSIQAAFRECHGLGSENEVIEYKASNTFNQDLYQKQPGKLKWENISLKRGITSDLALWEWRKKVEEGHYDEARSNGSIVMYDQMGTPKAEWTFERGWPCKLSGPSLNAATNEVAIEEVVIAHEKLVRVK